MNHTKQTGKILTGILIGLVLGCIIIASMLWYLNTHPVKFQTQHPVATPPPKKPVVLTPKDNSSIPEEKTSVQSKDESVDDIEQFIDKLDQSHTESKKETEVIIKKESVSPQDILEGKVSSGGNNHTVILQMGSFSKKEQAQTQQAKLSMLGVSSRIKQASVKGKTVYRVVSGSLSQDVAHLTQENLRKNHIKSILLTQH